MELRDLLPKKGGPAWQCTFKTGTGKRVDVYRWAIGNTNGYDMLYCIWNDGEKQQNTKFIVENYRLTAEAVAENLKMMDVPVSNITHSKRVYAKWMDTSTLHVRPDGAPELLVDAIRRKT